VAPNRLEVDVLLSPDSLQCNTGLVGVCKCPLVKPGAPVPDSEPAAASSVSSNGGSSAVFGNRAGKDQEPASAKTLPQPSAGRVVLPYAGRDGPGSDRWSNGGDSDTSDESAREPSHRRRVRVNSGFRESTAGRRPASSVEAEPDGSDGVALPRDDGVFSASEDESDSGRDGHLCRGGVSREKARSTAHRGWKHTKPALRVPVPDADGEGRHGRDNDGDIVRQPSAGFSMEEKTLRDSEWSRGAAGDHATESDFRGSSRLQQPMNSRIGSISRAPKQARGGWPLTSPCSPTRRQS
jgi:hypothetical protein